MNKNQTPNTPAIFQRYQAQAQRSVAIEDGNPPNESNQGVIATSEISSDDGYSISYSAPINAITPIKISYDATKLYNYTIDIGYDVELIGGTNPGFFGSNLLKPNDNFVIGGQGHDWVKGFINKVSVTAYTDTQIQQGYKIILSSVGNTYWGGGLVSISVDGVTVMTSISGPSEVAIPANIGFGSLIRVWLATVGTHPLDLRFRVVDIFDNEVIPLTNPVVGTNISGGTTATATLTDSYVYYYQLTTTIVDGDPLQVKPNTSIFYWTRQISESSENAENQPPQNITFAYQPFTHESKLFWQDKSQKAKRHIVQIRDISSTNPPNYQYIPTYGNQINFQGQLRPIVDVQTTDVSTIQIIDAGLDFTHPRRIELIGEGQGALFLANPYSFDGSLPIHEYEVVGISVGTNDMLIRSLRTYPYWGYPIPMESAYIEGLPAIAFGHYKVSTVTQVGSNLFNVFFDYAENSGISVSIPLIWNTTVLNSTLRIHNGIQRVSLTSLPINATLGLNKIELPPNQYLSNGFLGCYISSAFFPGNTYITNITNKFIEFNNEATSGGNGFLDISGNGVGYTTKTRARVGEVDPRAQLHLDPIWEQSTNNNWLFNKEMAISVASVLDEAQKIATGWSPEIYTKNLR
jgi:hypothetical protein